MSYKNVSSSMNRVIKSGAELERLVKKILNAKGGNIRYDNDPSVRLQTDIALPNTNNPETIFSITHTDPDKPGHSNENKFQLKLGEIYLIKTFNPSIRCVMVLGGTKDAWLQYVLKAFPFFFDEVVYLWEKDFKKNLLKACNCQLKNSEFWKSEKKRRNSISLAKNINDVPTSSLRASFHNKTIKKYLGVVSPNLIQHPLLKRMASSAHKAYVESIGKGGLFWKHLSTSKYEAIWQERNYFNPNEAAIEHILDSNDFFYLGKTGQDVEISNLLHDFGLTRTRVGEDFVLYSRKHDMPVYIQCKASGGGKKQHGKNIMNRAKEQNGRSVLYRCKQEGTHLISKSQDFFWIGILDGNWKLPTKTPTKYYNMLKIAGYSKLIGADSLVDNSLIPLRKNALISYLTKIDCYKKNNIPPSKKTTIEKNFKIVTEII